MAEKIYDVLEKYDFNVENTKKGRGVIILDTDKGPKILKEYTGSGNYVALTAQILEGLDIKTDNYIKNTEGGYISMGSDGIKYVVKEWYHCRDCDLKSYGDVMNCMSTLARLHNELSSFGESGFKYEAMDPYMRMKRKTDEMYRVKKYLVKKNNRNEFELMVTAHCEKFIKEGESAMEKFKNFKELSLVPKGICHGNYNHHNICFSGNESILINFEKMHYDYYTSDIYHIMRKILEKYDWDIKLGHGLMIQYDKIRPLKDEEVKMLGILFAYPEKFWKIINSYFNSGKTWLFNRNCEKLGKITAQNEKRWDFINTL